MSCLNISNMSLQDMLPSPVSGEGWKPVILSEAPESYINDMARARASLREAERVIRAQEDHIRRLENMALVDDLTGLLNRRGFLLALQRELSMARRDSDANGVLVMADLDGFKSINDVYGHPAGDDYLQAVAHALVSAVRAGDIVARLGGDEFAVILPRMSEKAGLKRLASLERTFNSRIVQFGDKGLALRASFGMSGYRGADSPEAVFISADRKLYAHKESRRALGV